MGVVPGGDFNADFHVSFTKDEIAKGKVNYNYTMQEFPSAEAPGLSVFCKDADGEIFHTYSAYARGLEPLIGTYTLLDLVPKGRDEDQLGFRMGWLRHHDRYGTDVFLDPTRPYWPPNAPLVSSVSSTCGCGAEDTRENLRLLAGQTRPATTVISPRRNGAVAVRLPDTLFRGCCWCWCRSAPPASRRMSLCSAASASPCQPPRICGRCW